MKKNILILLFTISPLVFFAQEETKPEKENIEVSAIEPEEVQEDIPFAIIEDVPIFPGCEKLDKHLQKMCFQNKLGKHVGINFNTGLANELNLDNGKKRVYIIFKIDKKGNIVDVKARGPHKKLEMEGLRVIKLLPQMTPGKLRGKPIGVKYTLPITLLVEGKKENKDSNGN